METLVLLVGLIVVSAVLLVESGLIHFGAPVATIPKVQTFANSGDQWQINTTAPRVVDFQTSGPAVIWMNASLHNGISVFLCPSSVIIQPMVWPGNCTAALGGAEKLNGSWQDINDAGSWELAFINFGPQSGYLPAVTITWISPLEVVET